MKRKWMVRGIVVVIWAAVLWSILGVGTYPSEKLKPVESVRIEDRFGRLLRDAPTAEGNRARWVKLEKISPHVVAATIAAEDRRFFAHSGVDGRAVLRALYDDLTSGRVVSGASTITMQVVRLIEPRPRTLLNKFREAILARRLERTIDKRTILEQYLNRAPYGNGVVGIEAASRLYFGKPSRDLSIAEAAFLAGLPQGPTRLNPYRARDLAMKRQRWILDAMKLSVEERERALSEPLDFFPRSHEFLAPHFIRLARGGRTTLDLDLQRSAEGIVRGHVALLADRGVTNGAAVIFDNATGDILAMVGSVDFFEWQNNAAIARRSPGSTVKPFTYAIAFERGRTPDSALDDSSCHFETPGGDYSPRNYDDTFRGRVTAREALACSLNVPAVRLLASVGTRELHARLRAMDWPLEGAPDRYGLGLTLGDGETTLLHLTSAYAALARGGEWIAPRVMLDDPVVRRRIFDPSATRAVLDILSDDEARAPVFGRGGVLSFPFRVFAKTGTSADFRDNWVVGGTRRYTVGVWVGNFDGSPMHGVSGITGAGPIFRDIILALGDDTWVEELPTRDSTPIFSPAPDLTILRPNRWDVFLYDPTRPSPLQTIGLEAAGAERIAWFVDGRPVVGARWPITPGRHEARVVDLATGKTRTTNFRVE